MSTLTRTHSPPSLPSFAQTFPNIAPAADLVKPMQHTLPPIHRFVPNSRKRSRDDDNDDVARRDGRQQDERRDERRAEGRREDARREDSAAVVRDARRRSSASSIKRESPSVSPSPTPASMDIDQLDQLDQSPSPPRRLSKKRRIVGGDRDHHRDRDRDSLSPVVVVSTPPSSDQGAIEQVRAMLSIKQKQKELIDQRRGSAAGILQSTPGSSAAVSPRPGPPVRRHSGIAPGSAAGPSASSPRTSPKQPPPQPPPAAAVLPTPGTFSNPRRRKSANGLGSQSQPPPPIARSSTRAAPPRPLMLAPHSRSRRLEPLVHSAPPIGGFGPLRVPSLPPIPITPGLRPSSSSATVAISKSARSAVAASATAATATPPVPPTPAYATQQRTGKAGFLQLFDDFYDSLADSRLLKQWLQDQLTRSAALLESHEDLLERAVAPLRNEVDGLRRRVGELEEMLLRERDRDRDRERQGKDLEPKRSGYVFPDRHDAVAGDGRLSTSAVRLETAPTPVPAAVAAQNQHRPSPLRSAENAST